MNRIPIRKELFWDIDTNKLDINTHKKLIIERVLKYGNISEFKFIVNHYKISTIKEEIKKIGYLDPKTFNFVISYFNLSKNQLKCYTRKQSRIQHWS